MVDHPKLRQVVTRVAPALPNARDSIFTAADKLSLWAWHQLMNWRMFPSCCHSIGIITSKEKVQPVIDSREPGHLDVLQNSLLARCWAEAASLESAGKISVTFWEHCSSLSDDTKGAQILWQRTRV